jgi:hypothetical protein
MSVRIPDQALHLLLLDAAWQEGLLPAFDKVAFYRDQLGITWTFDADYSKQPDPRVLTALLAIPLEPETLAQITAFDWDGANQVCSDIWSQWAGEDAMFDIRQLNGLEACTALRTLDFIGGAFHSIEPLRGLLALEELDIWALEDPLTDLSPLLGLPALKRLSLNGNYLATPANVEILATLQRRGVNTTELEESRARGDAQYRARQVMAAKDAGAAAFRERRYSDVLKALAPYETELPESDRKKLAFARRQLGLT